MVPHDRSATLSEIVRCYRSGEPERELERRWWMAGGRSFRDCLSRVGQAHMQDGRRHPHQRRLRHSVLDACAAALEQAEAQIRAATTFDQLLTVVRSTFVPIHGAGELAVYDAADRLRHRLGLESQDRVYLHAGARIGARRLAGGRLLLGERRSMPRPQLPTELQSLSTHEAEDVLCIFKDYFFGSPEAVRARWAQASGAHCMGRGRLRC